MKAFVTPLLALLIAAALAATVSARAQAASAQADTVEQLRQELADTKADLARMHIKLEQVQEALADLEQHYTAQIEALEAKLEGKAPEEEDLTALRRAAEAEAAEAPPEREPEEVTFRSGALGLQALNPEISATGDFLGTLSHPEDAATRSDFELRTLEVAFESYLDPYSRLKAIVEFNNEGAELGEAYFDRYGVGRDLNLTLGKFRQQFGVVNRWHKHGLDQVDFPLALRHIFGPGGLNQTGLSLDWSLPAAGNVAQDLTLQVTDGENPLVFGGNTRNIPSALLHYKNYRDLSKDTYLEFGLTGLVGRNDEWPVQPPGGELASHKRNLWTTVLGADLTLLWEPTERMRYRNWLWRTEAYWLDRDILAPDGSGQDTLNAWGAYSYFQTKLNRTTEVGLRADYFEPDTKSYADIPGASLAPHAVTGADANRWMIAPYVTWSQSPWVHYRLEYNHEDGSGTGPADDRLLLQAIFSAGPHKHERY
ncbi:MAG: hypothetical protein JSV65_03670 [Armatimonadota bacterium]|nr:MAG: hypothetical protein JSV65_03670 [Armatimonadota bacterium]